MISLIAHLTNGELGTLAVAFLAGASIGWIARGRALSLKIRRNL